MEPEVRAAVERSFLAQLPAAALERLLLGAVLEPVSAGTTTYRAGGEPRPSLIVSGLVGSVREVVARALRELRDEGIVRVNRSGIVVLEPTLLAARAWPVT